MKKIVLIFVFALMVAAAPALAKGLALASWGGGGTLNYDLTEAITAGLGAGYTSAGGGVYTLLVDVDYKLAKVGDVQTSAGLYYTTDTTGLWGTIGVTYGVATLVQPNLSLGVDFILANSAKVGAATTTNILPATAVTAVYYL